MAGKVIPLSEVKDEAFSGELLGKGCAIEPKDGKVVAPCNGTIGTLFPTLHAIGILTDGGVELLIHIGLDTVQLEGKGFTAHVKQGDKITKGQLLVSVDMNVVKEAGYSLVTPIIVTNTDDYSDIVQTANGPVKANDEILNVIY